ncbi:hypothetical protein AVEN_229827-1, partial [Araneus ventricosus]
DAMRNHNNFEFSIKKTKVSGLRQQQIISGGWWYEEKTFCSHLEWVHKPGADDLVNVFLVAMAAI